MQNYRILYIIVVTTLLFISGTIFSQSELSTSANTKGIIKAESMELKHYKIDNNGYIKLTDSTGTAQSSFVLPSGKYDIDVRYKSESVGQNCYVFYIANNQIVAWLGKDRDDQWHKLTEQRWHTPHNIEINYGDKIKIEGQSENGSLVIFDYIEFKPSAQLASTQPSVLNKPAKISVQASSHITTSQENLVTIYPEEYEKAIKNPLKGFRPSNQDQEYATLMKSYVGWNELEQNARDGVDKIKRVCDEKWLDIEKKNLKVIPRVVLLWPKKKEYWPEDMTPGDFTSNQFKERVIAMIKKLGEAWDNDSRVAYVEMGIIGQWGEMEYPDTRDDIKVAIANQFNESFKNKLVMIRWPNTYQDHIYNFGYYWDSFAHIDQEYCAFHINNTSPKWKTAVIGGEAAFEWGNFHIQPGQNSEEALSKPVHRDYILDRIRKLHANHVGRFSDYNPKNKNLKANAEMLQKALGYRFVISEVSYSKEIDSDSYFTVSFKVKNQGSSPFYYNWPLEVSLLDPNTKLPVWKKQFTNVDIREWLPGDKWDDDLDKYEIPAETYIVKQSFKLTKPLPSGEYVLALAILDPAGNRPAARFAIKNYYNGGRHPIGKIGVNKLIDSFSITEFDDLQSDNSLSYDRVVK